VGRAARDHQDGSAARELPAAVTDDLTALDGVAVQHVGANLEGAAVAEPQLGPDPLAETHLRVGLGEPGHLVAGQVRDPDLAGAEPGGDDVGHQLLGFGQVAAVTERQVDARAHHPYAGPRAGQRRSLAQAASGEAVPLHRGHPLEHDPGVAVAVQELLEVLEPADGADDPVVERRVDRGRLERAPAGQHQEVAVEPAGHGTDLGRRTDGDGVDAEPGGLPCQPGEPEPVAVALDHRDQAGPLLGDLAQVCAPTVTLDVQDHAHPRLLRYSWNAP